MTNCIYTKKGLLEFITPKKGDTFYYDVEHIINRCNKETIKVNILDMYGYEHVKYEILPTLKVGICDKRWVQPSPEVLKQIYKDILENPCSKTERDFFYFSSAQKMNDIVLSISKEGSFHRVLTSNGIVTQVNEGYLKPLYTPTACSKIEPEVFIIKVLERKPCSPCITCEEKFSKTFNLNGFFITEYYCKKNGTLLYNDIKCFV